MQLISEKKISIELIENDRIVILLNLVSKKRCQLQMILNRLNLEVLFIHATTTCASHKKNERCLESLVGKKVGPDFPGLVDEVTDDMGCLLIKDMLKEIFNGLAEADLVSVTKPDTCEICGNGEEIN